MTIQFNIRDVSHIVMKQGSSGHVASGGAEK
jgi:hypothetical protein